MSPYEIALLVVVAIVVVVLTWETQRLRWKVKDLEYGEKRLQNMLRHQAEVHQKIMDSHTRSIERLDEQTGEISQRAERFRQSQPDFVKLRADMDRLLKSEMYRSTASRAAMQNLLEDGQAELRGREMEH